MNDESQIARIEKLFAEGLETQWHERASTSQDVNEVAARLRATSDLAEKLKIAGFTRTPYVSGRGDDEILQACETCMYYIVHRKFCSLPELRLPVKPEWSCILWRI